MGDIHVFTLRSGAEFWQNKGVCKHDEQANTSRIEAWL